MYLGDRNWGAELMPVQVKEQTSGNSLIGLQVDIAGLRIVVRKGSFRVDGQDYLLTDDEEYTVVPVSKRQFIDGSLYLDLSSGEVHVLMFSIEEGESNYDWRDPNMKPLYGIFEAELPKNVKSLDEGEVRVFQTVRTPISKAPVGGEA